MNPVNMEVKFTRALPPISKKTTDIDIVMSMNQIVVSTIFSYTQKVFNSKKISYFRYLK